MERQITFRISQEQFDKFSQIISAQGLTITDALRSFVVYVNDTFENSDTGAYQDMFEDLG